MGERRKFGNIRKLPSGRFQARYKGPDGVFYNAPETFGNKTDANNWLVLRESEILRKDWTAPDAGKIRFGTFATDWIDDRVLKHRTEVLYRGLLKNHLAPTFGNCYLSDIKEADVRRWRKERLGVVGQSTVAKAYQLLKSIMGTAVEDELIRRYPCRIKGAGMPSTPEREMIPLTKVVEIVTAVPDRYRALVLLGTFASLRWSELVGLRRTHHDLDQGVLRVAGAGRDRRWQGAGRDAQVASRSADGFHSPGDHSGPAGTPGDVRGAGGERARLHRPQRRAFEALGIPP